MAQMNVSNSPRKAEGDTVPLLRETMTLMPVSTNGTENSTTSDLSSLMVREPMAMSALLDTTWKTRHLDYIIHDDICELYIFLQSSF